MTTTDEKIDALLRSVESLRRSQDENQEEMSRKLLQLENDVRTSQEDASQRLAKKIRREKLPEFRKKGHEKQYFFIEEIKDRVETASGLLVKIKPADERDTALMEAASEELEAGSKALLARQKLIRMADRSELGWQVVNAYESDELASGDEDAKRIEKAEKAAEQKAERRRKKIALKGARSRPLRRVSQPARDVGAPGPSRSFVPAPVIPQPPMSHRRVPGPCFNCLEMGHLKGNCPKLSKMYPLSKSVHGVEDVCTDSVSQRVSDVQSLVKGRANKLGVSSSSVNSQVLMSPQRT